MAEGQTTAEPGLETRRMQSALERALFGHASAPVRVGRFAILELIGQGGMGTVYLAYDPRLDRRVAVKVMHGRDREHAARLTEEALALARLNHPNVVTIHEVGDHDDGIFVAMEYVDGGTLERWCSPDSLPRDRWRHVLALAEQAARGLVAAHAVGIVHCDLKPANMLIGSDGRLRLGDFGLAIGTTEAHADTMPAAAGTPAYMAPEQFDGHADERSDQFSLCASFFHAFYGKRCFPGSAAMCPPDHDPSTVIATVAARGHVPRHIETALLRGLSLAPAERFPSVSVLLEALRPPTRRHWWWVGAATVVGGAALVVAMDARMSEPPCVLERELPGEGWSTARRVAVAAGIRATGVPHAEGTLARVEAQLDRTVARWQEQRDAACVAERSNHPDGDREREGTRAVECLRAAAHTLDSVTSRLVRPEADDVTRASDALVLMEDLTDCDRDTLDPEHDDARAQALLQTLYDGRVAAKFGDAEVARDAFERILAETRPGELSRVRAIAHLQLAQIFSERDDDEQARAHDRQWLDEAELAGDAELAANAWASMAGELGPDVPIATARFYLDRARVYERRGELGPTRRADLDWKAALVVSEHGEHVEAIALVRRAIAALPDDDVVILPHVLITLSDELIVTDDFAGAIEARERGVALLEERLGPAHPDVAIGRVSLAEVRAIAQDEEGALALLDDAIATFDANPLFRPRVRAQALISRGTTRANLGQNEAAIEDLERAEDLVIGLDPPDERQQALLLDPLARTLFNLERRGQALDVVDRGIALAERVDAVSLHDFYLLRAEILVALDRIDEAVVSLERGVALRADVFEVGSVSHLQAVEETAKVLISIRRLDAAERELTDVLALPNMPVEWAARLRLQYARALAERGRRDAAREQAHAVRDALAHADALPSTRADLDVLLTSLE
jgi:tetratricopeptide (TPR) repeat protein